MLKAPELGSLDSGTPIYFRRFEVGQVASYALDPDGKALTVRVFVKAPYDHFLTKDTRFWQAIWYIVVADLTMSTRIIN